MTKPSFFNPIFFRWSPCYRTMVWWPSKLSKGMFRQHYISFCDIFHRKKSHLFEFLIRGKEKNYWKPHNRNTTLVFSITFWGPKTKTRQTSELTGRRNRHMRFTKVAWRVKRYLPGCLTRSTVHFYYKTNQFCVTYPDKSFCWVLLN